MTGAFKVFSTHGAGGIQKGASFDCRLLPDADIDEFVSSIENRASRQGGHVANVTQKGRGPISGKGALFESSLLRR